MRFIPNLLCVASLGALAACSGLPTSAPAVQQHDLGAPLAALPSTTPVRSVAVTASPVVGSLAMQYRRASQPTVRHAYAYNRWVAAPAVLLAQSLKRQLVVQPGSRCVLQVQLGEFMLDLDSAGQARALLSAQLILNHDAAGELAQRNLDLSIPLPQAEPGVLATGLRQASQQLALDAQGWLQSAASRCQPES